MKNMICTVLMTAALSFAALPMARAADDAADAKPELSEKDRSKLEADLAAARERLETAAREVGRLSGELTGPIAQDYFFAHRMGRGGAVYRGGPQMQAMPMTPGVPGAPPAPGLPIAPNGMFTQFFGPDVLDMELVSLTPKLGRYFGADNGVLVVRTPSDSAIKLEEGDVILDIDGRQPQSGVHAMRILRSYQPGEKVNFKVLRDRKKVQVAVTMPEARHWRGRSDDGPRIETRPRTFKIPEPSSSTSPPPPPPPGRDGGI